MSRPKGLRTNRFSREPLEKAIAEAFAEECCAGVAEASFHPDLVDQALSTQSGGWTPTASKSEHQAVHTIIQWLGSPVGRNFLRKIAELEKEIPL